jgi:hypothetical protein
MKYIFTLLLVIAAVVMLAPTPVTLPGPLVPVVEIPTVNLPVNLRQSNWGGGSCVHATLVSLFRWQGRYAMADYWRKTYSDGEYADKLAEKLDKEDVRYAYINGKYDVDFLEWACETRRGCGVTVTGKNPGDHFVLLCDLTDTDAYIMDNNSTQKYKVIPRDEFLTDWKRSGSWAMTVLYAPAAPLPNKDKETK